MKPTGVLKRPGPTRCPGRQGPQSRTPAGVLSIQGRSGLNLTPNRAARTGCGPPTRIGCTERRPQVEPRPGSRSLHGDRLPQDQGIRPPNASPGHCIHGAHGLPIVSELRHCGPLRLFARRGVDAYQGRRIIPAADGPHGLDVGPALEHPCCRRLSEPVVGDARADLGALHGSGERARNGAGVWHRAPRREKTTWNSSIRNS